MLLIEQVYGDRGRMEFGRLHEREYASLHLPDLYPPPVRTSGGDYDRGPWVMWMLQQEMGRENVLAGLRAFIEEYKAGPDYPVIQDMLAVLRDFAPDTAAFDAFAEQWFFGAVLPEYKLSGVTKVREGDGWVVRGTVENVGTGRMRVEVGAVAGERWLGEGDDVGWGGCGGIPGRSSGRGGGDGGGGRVRDPGGVRARARRGRPGCDGAAEGAEGGGVRVVTY